MSQMNRVCPQKAHLFCMPLMLLNPSATPCKKLVIFWYIAVCFSLFLNNKKSNSKELKIAMVIKPILLVEFFPSAKRLVKNWEKASNSTKKVKQIKETRKMKSMVLSKIIVPNSLFTGMFSDWLRLVHLVTSPALGIAKLVK